MGTLTANLIEVLGPEAAQALFRVWGGTRLHVPFRCPPDHPLVEVLGVVAANKLCAEYGGRDWDIPKGMRQFWVDRDRLIRQERSHYTVKELVRRFQLSQRRIWQILQKQPAEELQSDREQLELPL